MHTRFLQVEGRKMAKRLGNFHTVRELVNDRGVAPLALRLALISGQYRKPFNFTFSTLRDSERHVARFSEAFKLANSVRDRGQNQASTIGETLKDRYQSVLNALLDDLNTPAAIAHALDGVRTILGHKNQLDKRAYNFMRGISDLLGIVPTSKVLSAEPTETQTESEAPDIDPLTTRIEELVQARSEARKTRNFALADKIRDELLAMNIEIKDNPNGTSWRKKSNI